MKRIISLLSLITLFFGNILSQEIPHIISYQGVLKDAAGGVVPNGEYILMFKFYNSESGGSELWSETKPINVVDGIINTELGSTEPIPFPIFFESVWLGITIGSGSELTPRIALTSVPYSFMSMNVPDSSINSAKIPAGEVVKSLNGLKDSITLVAGSNITITPSGNDLTISSSGGGSGTIGGSGNTNYVPLFTNSTTLGNSVLYQNNNKIGLGTSIPDFNLTINSDLTNGLGLKVLRSATGGLCGLSMVDQTQGVNLQGWSIVSLQQMLKINATADNGYTPLLNLITIDRVGNFGIGTENPTYPLHVTTNRQCAGRFTSDSLNYATNVVEAEYTGSGPFNAVAFQGTSWPSDGYGTGGEFYGGYKGIEALAFGGNHTGFVFGVSATAIGNTGSNVGVYGRADQSGSGLNYGIYGEANGGTTNWAGYFTGNVNISGSLSKAGGSFKIDHPLDPAKKYLYHSFVESPDMMNIYNGNVVLDVDGEAIVELPAYFETLNYEYRYQLTAIGSPGPNLFIASEISGNRFTIAGGKSGMKVSWQITGIRQDAYAKAHRIIPEVEKTGSELGKYLHPKEFGLPENKGIDFETSQGMKDNKKRLNKTQ